MKTKNEIVENWLPRYTKRPIEDFGEYILLTNFNNYVDLLFKNNIAISMTENGDPYENALAERVNGIIKTEFNLYSSLLGFEQTRNQISRSIKSYNELRPHTSCDYLTPNQAHLQSDKLNKRWKNYNKSANSSDIDHPIPI